MGENSAIEWTNATWNPVTGCTKVSPACANCYIERQTPMRVAGRKFVRGDIPLEFHENRLDAPLRRRKPTTYFVNSMSDLFHEDVPDAFIDQVFAVMALAPRHTFQVLTKRPERMRAYCDDLTIERLHQHVNGWASESMEPGLGRITGRRIANGFGRTWATDVPLPNVWLGVSVENQHFADERIPLLLETPAAVRFISAEPLLGPLSIERHLRGRRTIHMSADVEGMVANRSFDGLNDNGRPLTRREAETGLREMLAKGVKRIKMSDECVGFDDQAGCPGHPEPSVDWVIAGGESGPRVRPSNPDWFRSLRDQCVTAGVPFFFKQWGGRTSKSGGRLLDGRTWDEMPKASA